MTDVQPHPKYDRQLVIVLTADGDERLQGQAQALDAKTRKTALPSEVVAVRPSGAVGVLRDALAGRGAVALPVSGASRLYLVGDCVDGRTVAGMRGAEVAQLLVDAGLRAVALISIVADGAGREADCGVHDGAAAGDTSFALALHVALGAGHGIRTTVNARVGTVHVLEAPRTSGGVTVEAGRKVTGGGENGATGTHHATASKLRYGWDGVVPSCDWAY